MIRIVKLYKGAVLARANAEKRKREALKAKKIKDILEDSLSNDTSKDSAEAPKHQGKLEVIEENEPREQDGDNQNGDRELSVCPVPVGHTMISPKLGGSSHRNTAINLLNSRSGRILFLP